MSCANCRQLLLDRADFEPMPSDAEAHLAQCPACRRWQAQLASIEKCVPRLPVPPSDRKQAFQEAVSRGLQPAPVSIPIQTRMAARHWVMVGAGGAAAAGILVMVGILLHNALSRSSNDVTDINIADKKPRPEKVKQKLPDTLAGRLLAKNFDLAKAVSAEARLESLASLALLLHEEGRTLAPVAGPKEMNALADLYGKVVEGGIVPRARDLPVDRRRALDPIRNRLAEAGKEAEKMAKAAPPEKAEPWLRIAAVARTGQRQLSALIAEATP